MGVPTAMRLAAATFVAGGLIGAAAAIGIHLATVQAGPVAPADDLAALKASFRRPASVPFPADNPFSEAKRLLGEALSHAPPFSIDRSLAAASCHNPGKGFA